MIGWLKRWTADDACPETVVGEASIEDLVAQSQELGRQIDALRDQRRILKEQIEALIPAPEGG